MTGTKKYCKFLEDIYDDQELIWQKGQSYLVIFENDELYQFGDHAISKKDEGKYYTVWSEYD